MSRPIYTEEQIYQIYDRISLPQKHRHRPGQESSTIARGPGGLDFLSALQRHHIASIPFENLELHYSPAKVILTDHELLFRKIVSQATGRGGYCMENNVFFATLLRSLGFRVMSTGGRVNAATQPMDPSSSSDAEPLQRYTGWSHMLNIVTIQGERYVVDVGFGTGQSTRPLRLADRVAAPNMPPSQRVRVRWAAIPENEDQDSKVWIFERQDGPGAPWVPTYCFPDNLEFLPSDFVVANHFTSSHRSSWFTYRIVCAKFLLDEAGEEVVGTVVLSGNAAHRRVRGVREELGTFGTEAERVAALEEFLGVRLSEHQKAGIAGTAAALS